ncbi:histidine kinase [Marinoscillum furvescens DSM 4134]|uniref:histidine kinase n=2 Tax=Marinoscillum furvescens TaxID=1026 RepID=A0A3D9L0R3_MARFU|nr:histidine kinase [Marinoscillum furvescens DSM 4134]
MIGLALILSTILSLIYYLQFKQALRERVLLQLSSVKQLKITQIRQTLDDLVDTFEAGMQLPVDPDVVSLLHYGLVHSDTTIGEYEIRLPENKIQRVTLLDLSDQDPLGRITLGMLRIQAGEYLLAIVQPEIQAILMERTGLGETGESYLVGPDLRMRSSSRFFPRKIPTDIMVDSRGVRDALKGLSGSGLIEDYRGVRVFSAYEPIGMHGLQWIILSEIDEQEALFPLKRLRTNLLAVLSVVLVFILIGAYELSRQLVKPLVDLEARLKEMAKGVFQRNQNEEFGEDEIGQIFRALDKLSMALEQTVTFADRIGSGDFQANYDLLSEEDKLGTALLRMKERLQQYQENEKRLKLENQRSLIQGAEKERSRLSREMHDGLGPLLTLARIRLENSELQATRKQNLTKLIDEIITEMRKMSNNLMPSVLTDFGAGEAIRNLVAQVDKKRLDIRYLYDKSEDVEISENISIAIFRVVQEALNNVLRHAKASKMSISFTEFPDRVSLFIKDDGQGFDPSMTFGNGIRNMRERVNVENGIFEISSGPQGSTIEVEIPLK